MNRFHIIDDIPFTKSFKFDIENWHWNPACDTTRAAISYWYARPGCWDDWFFGPVTKDDVKIEPMPGPAGQQGPRRDRGRETAGCREDRRGEYSGT